MAPRYLLEGKGRFSTCLRAKNAPGPIKYAGSPTAFEPSLHPMFVKQLSHFRQHFQYFTVYPVSNLHLFVRMAPYSLYGEKSFLKSK